jgi:hypothetical protein
MPNFCDCSLKITGPNRQAVLDRIKGEPYEGEPVFFDVEKIIPRPEDLGDRWQDWSYENWGCRNVYPDRQWHREQEDSDTIGFYTPWNPPLYVIQTLSAMYPEVTFLLRDGGLDLPHGTTMYRGGKGSQYYIIPNYNSNTGKTATLYEIFCSVLRRTGEVDEALAVVEREKALRLAPSRSAESTEMSLEDVYDQDDSDPALDAEVEAIIAPYLYDVSMISADEEQIAQHIAVMPMQADQSKAPSSSTERLDGFSLDVID